MQANGLSHVATAVALPWGQPVDHLHPPYNTVLAADVLYELQALPLFVQTLAALSGPGASPLTVLCSCACCPPAACLPPPLLKGVVLLDSSTMAAYSELVMASVV